MIIGIRELRTKIASLVLYAQKDGKIIILTKNNKPVIGLVNINLLEKLAGTNILGKDILDEIKKANNQGNENFSKYLDTLINSTKMLLSIARYNKLDKEIIEKIENIRFVYENLVNRNGGIEDERLVSATVRKMIELYSSIVEKDYYNTSEQFVDKAKQSMSQLIFLKKSGLNQKFPIDDFHQLDDLVTNHKIITQHTKPLTVGAYTSILVKISKTSNLHTFKIISFLPFEYKGKNLLPNFTTMNSPIGRKLVKKSVGDIVVYRGLDYRIEAIT